MSHAAVSRQFERRFRAMGTTVALLLWHEEEPRARNALDSAERYFAQMEQRLSRFLPGSELARLNRAANRPFQATPILFDLVTLALEWRRRTGGIFDPGTLAALKAAGYDRPFDDLRALADAEGQIDLRGPAAALDGQRDPATDGVVLGPGRLITLPAGLELDLGGIAKGWVAQQAAYRLGRWGPALVDAGGDIACTAAPPTGSWVVTVADPLLNGNDIAVFTLEQAAVATSTRVYRRWRHNGRAAHHLIDPRTGEPAVTSVVSATVVATRLPDAEIHAKTALILGEVDGLAYLDRQPDISAILVTEDGRRLHSGSREGVKSVPFDTFAAASSL